MADAYYSYLSGLSGNSGLTEALPKDTRANALAVAGAGDTLRCLDGTHVHESGHFVMDDNQIESALNYRQAILQANAAETTRVARSGAALGAANNTLAEWNAQSEVTDDVIVQMPIGEIRAMAKRFKMLADPISLLAWSPHVIP